MSETKALDVVIGVRLPSEYRDFLAARKAVTGATAAAQIRLMIAEKIETATTEAA